MYLISCSISFLLLYLPFISHYLNVDKASPALSRLYILSVGEDVKDFAATSAFFTLSSPHLSFAKPFCSHSVRVWSLSKAPGNDPIRIILHLFLPNMLNLAFLISSFSPPPSVKENHFHFFPLLCCICPPFHSLSPWILIVIFYGFFRRSYLNPLNNPVRLCPLRCGQETHVAVK